MGQGIGRPATALVICLLGLPPAFALDWQAGGTPETLATVELGGSRPCPTRFDYVVLASFSDASNLLSLSTYHFRSEVGFSTVPLTSWQRVVFKVESGDCRPIGSRAFTGVGSPR